MAIELDAVVEALNTDTVEAIVASNDNRLLIVSTGVHQGNQASAVTWDTTQDMILIKAQIGEYGEHVQIWGLLAPNIGTHNVVLTGQTNSAGIGVISLFNVDQVELPQVTEGASDSSNNALNDITTIVDGSWVIDVVEAEPVPRLDTVDGVQDWELQDQSYQNYEGSHVPKASAGLVTTDWQMSYGARWNWAGCVVKPVDGAPPVTVIKDPIGVGVIPFAR
jgi:hypothetical protein